MARNNSRSRNSRRHAGSQWLGIAAISVVAVLIITGWVLTRSVEAKDAATPVAHGSHYEGLLEVELPADLPSQKVDYNGFSVSFNADRRVPNYSAWEVLGEREDIVSRSNNFWQDSRVVGCPTSADYKRSGYDRGHLCPAADMKWSQDAMNDCFVMANICPQDHKLNSGAWNTLEAKERQWAKRDSAIVVIAGPVFTSPKPQTIGTTGVCIPDAFFKVIAAPYADTPRGIAFVYPNMAAPGNFRNYAMSIDEVERLTGYNFFSQLPDSIQTLMEATYSFNEWNR